MNNLEKLANRLQEIANEIVGDTPKVGDYVRFNAGTTIENHVKMGNYILKGDAYNTFINCVLWAEDECMKTKQVDKIVAWDEDKTMEIHSDMLKIMHGALFNEIEGERANTRNVLKVIDLFQTKYSIFNNLPMYPVDRLRMGAIHWLGRTNVKIMKMLTVVNEFIEAEIGKLDFNGEDEFVRKTILYFLMSIAYGQISSEFSLKTSMFTSSSKKYIWKNLANLLINCVLTMVALMKELQIKVGPSEGAVKIELDNIASVNEHL